MLEDVGLAEKKDIVAGSLSRGDKRRLGAGHVPVPGPETSAAG